MSTQVKTFGNSYSSVKEIGDQLSDWLLQEQNFSIKHKEWHNDSYIISVVKSGFFRQISGLVFEYKIELKKVEHSIVATISDGDIRKQLAALGVAWFVAWPILLTAGYGMFASGEFRQEIFAKVESLTGTGAGVPAYT